MKINFNVWHTTKGGGARYIFEVSNRLVERGHDVMITALSGDHRWFDVKANVNYVPIPRKFSWLKLLGIYTKLKFGRSLRILDVHHIFKKLNRSNWIDINKIFADSMPNCDINVATFGLTVHPTYFSKKGIPFHYVQGYDPRNYEKKVSDIILDAYKLPIRKLVVSKWLAKRVKEVTGQDAFYVGSGVDVKIFKPDKLVDKEPYTVGATLRTAKWKRCEDVIKTLNRVSEKIPNLKLIATGTREDVKELEKIASEKTEFGIELVETKNDNDLVRFYSRPSVFLYTPEEEGFGLPPLESMSCGTPVVTTDCKGVREYSIDNYNAVICKVGNVENLAKSVTRILTNKSLLRKMSSNSVKTAKKWTWKKVADRLEAIFEKSMKEN